MWFSIGKPSQIFSETKIGLRPTWINLRRGSLDSGILIFCIDPLTHGTGKMRINITCLAVTHWESFDEAIKVGLAYIWNNTQAEEIRIGLYHFKHSESGVEKEQVDEDYKSVLKKFNFWWKQVISL